MKGGGILIFFGLIWSGMTLLFDGFTVVPAVRQIWAQRFATAPGTILSSEVTYHDDSDGTTHGVRITYSYTVAGREYTGDRFRYDKSSSSDSAWAHRAVSEHPAGSPTTVYYDPQAPENAVLRTGLEGSDLFMTLFMTPFNVVMLGFWRAGWNLLWRRWRKPIAGGVKLRTALRQTRAQLTEFSPLATSIVTVALLAFLSIFVICFGFGGFHPSLRVVSVTWVIVLAGGALAGIWHWKNILGGKYDLVVDDLNGSIGLPLTCGRKIRKTFALAEVYDTFVDTIEKRDSEGSISYTHIPTLRLGTIDGPTEKLAEWHDAEKAREFVAWLKEKLGPRTSRYRAGNGPENLTQPQASG